MTPTDFDKESVEFLRRTVRITVYLGCIGTLALVFVNHIWAIGFGAGAAVSVVFLGTNMLFSRHVRPGGSLKSVRMFMAFYNLAKYAFVGVTVFLIVKLGIESTICFAVGFSLVYLVLVILVILLAKKS
jgi:hypothetical protein